MKIVIDKQKCIPFILSAVIIAADQMSKAFVAKNWPYSWPGTFIKDLFGNGLIQFYHVRNKAIAFSLGQNIPENLRPVLFIILPIIVLGFLVWYYFSSSDFRMSQRWAMAGIIGGGIGNIIDRIFRPDGVVDFIDIKFFEFVFANGRWPTFNVADSSVVVCCILLFIFILSSPKEDNKNGLPASGIDNASDESHE
ncbi:MAG: signal peptidase II [Treponema sp.]|jgi:signal peptidase II|nr:signal peptidase II [Treponema sp.]